MAEGGTRQIQIERGFGEEEEGEEEGGLGGEEEEINNRERNVKRMKEDIEWNALKGRRLKRGE